MTERRKPGHNSHLDYWQPRILTHPQGYLPTFNWRMHGLGMLVGYVDNWVRLHVWTPDANSDPIWNSAYKDDPDPYYLVHDHSYDLESRVLVGDLVDTRFAVTPTGWGTSSWEFKPGKHTAQSASPVHVRTLNGMGVSEGETYKIPRRQFHRTRVCSPLLVTLVHRTNKDPESDSVRVIGRRVPPPANTNAPKDQIDWLVGRAIDALVALKGTT